MKMKAAQMPPFIEETNVKRTKEFRKLQQKVMTYQRRNLTLDDDLVTELMIEYIGMVHEHKDEEDILAKTIEDEISRGNRK
jgi:hypothetical protein